VGVAAITLPHAYPAAEESAGPWGEPRLWRAAGDNRHVVGAGEARNNAFRDRAEPCFHKASDVRQDSIFERPIDIGGIAAVIANDYDRFGQASDIARC